MCLVLERRIHNFSHTTASPTKSWSQNMVSQLLILLFLFPLPEILCEETSTITIIVKGSTTVAETDDNFVCATLDWWPPEKCNYNQCPWGRASVLNLDLNQPLLTKAIGAFRALRIRIGGSLQDQVDYDIGNLQRPCLPFSKEAGGLFGFSKGCLSMARWNELNLLFQNTGAIVTFGLNALKGRHQIQKGVWGGFWNFTNARDFIEYTHAKGYPVDSWEFGNELSGRGIGASVDAEQYAKDLVGLKDILDNLYKNSSVKPLLLAPGGFFDQQWFAQLLQVSGSGILNGMTHHIYNLGGGNDPHIVNKILDPQYLNGIADTFRNLQLTIERYGPWSSAWVGEAGGAYNSGSRVVSSSFLNSFWYLDQLGMASKYNTKVYCRQTLIGGNYGLLDTKTFVPNPDYYSALLWHRLMGKGVLPIDISGSPYLRAYAHCRKHKEGVTVLLINLSKSTRFIVNVRNDININVPEEGSIHKDGPFVHGLKRTVSWVGWKASDGSIKREEYHLTAKDGNHLGHTVLLNGTPLELTKDGDIAALNPIFVAVNSPISVAPLSIAFVVFPNFEARACL